jgi:hypothetical protein
VEGGGGEFGKPSGVDGYWTFGGGGGFIQSKRDEGRCPSAHLRGVDDSGMQCHVVLVLNGYSREEDEEDDQLICFQSSWDTL